MACSLIKDCIQAEQKYCLPVEYLPIYYNTLLLLNFVLQYVESPFFVLSDATKQEWLHAYKSVASCSGQIIATPTTSSTLRIYIDKGRGWAGYWVCPEKTWQKISMESLCGSGSIHCIHYCILLSYCYSLIPVLWSWADFSGRLCSGGAWLSTPRNEPFCQQVSCI